MPRQREEEKNEVPGEQVPKKRGRKILGDSKKPAAQRSKEYRQRGVPLGSLVLTQAAGDALTHLMTTHNPKRGPAKWTKRQIVSAALEFAEEADLTPLLEAQENDKTEKGQGS